MKKRRTAEQLANDKARKQRANMRKQERVKAARVLRASLPSITYKADFSTDWIVDAGPDAPPWLERLESIPGATQSDLIASFGHIKLKSIAQLS